MRAISGLLVLSLLLVICINSCRNTANSTGMENLLAWCIVPFDNQNRTPEERIEMLKDLGFTSYAYDWREENLPEMAREISLARENGIEVRAVWMWIDANDSIGDLSQNNRKVFQILKETGLNTQIWLSFPESLFEGLSDEDRLVKAVNMVDYVTREADKCGCTVGMYNHGGWFGNPDNLVRIAETLPGKKPGIIFNFHHAHELLDEYPRMVEEMMPYLQVVNLNGMNPQGPQIVTIGKGSEEREMIRILEEKGFKGPYGILGHRSDADVKEILRQNMEGLKMLRLKMKN